MYQDYNNIRSPPVLDDGDLGKNSEYSKSCEYNECGEVQCRAFKKEFRNSYKKVGPRPQEGNWPT